MDSTKRVMVVDDEDDIRDTLALVLESEGYEVTTAANGRDALDRLDGALAPDLVLLDLMMPVMNGWDFHARLRQHPSHASLPVIAVTAFDDRTDDSLEGRAFDGYLQKPFDLDRLLSTVSRHSRRP